MKILLLNKNPMVSRLINLSAKKMSYELTEVSTYDDKLGSYDVIVVDHDVKADLKALKERCDKLIFLAPRDEEHDTKAQILRKPFLPTDFLNLLNDKAEGLDDVIALDPLDDFSFHEDSDSKDLKDEDGDLNLDSLSLDEEEQVTIAQKARDDEKNKGSDSESLLLDESENLSLDEDLDQGRESEGLSKDPSPDKVEIDEDSGNREEKGDSKEQGGEKSKDSDKSLDEIKSKDKDEDEIVEGNIETTEDLEHDKGDTPISKEGEKDERLSKENENIDEDESVVQDLKQDEEDVLAPEENQEDEGSFRGDDGDAKQDLKDKEEDSKDGEQDDIPIVESQEKEMDFDDLPQDAEFLGQRKEDSKGEDFLPFVESEILEPKNKVDSDLSVQDKIKEELAQLDELDIPVNKKDASEILKEFKDEVILKEEELGLDGEEVVIPDIELSDLDGLKESAIQQALGEEVYEMDDEKKGVQIEDSSKGEEIVNELSQSIAQTITSSIKDDTLKAALKGMNMNINIKISFDEDK